MKHQFSPLSPKNIKKPPLNTILNEKSEYFIQLEKKKIENKNKVESMKVNSAFDKIMGNEDNIRNYEYLWNQERSPKVFLPKIYQPGVKFKIVSDTERLNPHKYDKKDVVFDDFSKMFLNKKEKGESTQKINNIFYYSYKHHKNRKQVKRNKSPLRNSIEKEFLMGNSFNKHNNYKIQNGKSLLKGHKTEIDHIQNNLHTHCV